jgi:hypothetical protein
MISNTSPVTISMTAPRLRKQRVFGQYKHGRRWWGTRSAVGLIHTCYCGAEFRTEQARNRHLQQCHPDGDAA